MSTPAVERTALRFVADTAVHRAHAQPARRCERLEVATDLRGELAGRRKDQRGGLALAGPVDASDQRHAERDGLPEPVGARPQTSRPSSASGNGRSLDVERLCDAALRQYGDEVGGYAKILERASFMKGRD